MSTTAFQGPIIAGFGPDSNPELAPSLFWGGVAVLDPRSTYTYHTGQATGSATYGFLGAQELMTLNTIPFTLSNTAIAAAANVTNGTAMTLVSTSSSTTGVSVSQSLVNQTTGATITGLLSIESVAAATGTISGTTFTVASGLAGQFAVGMTLTGTSVLAGTFITAVVLTSSTVPTFTVNLSQTVSSTTITGTFLGIASCAIPFGQPGAQTVCLWNPQAIVSRAVSVTGVSGGAGGAFLVSGYDIYGFPMTQTITAAAGAATTNGTKAFKYIASVVPQFTDAHNYSVGTTDIYGFPIRSDIFADVSMVYPGSGATNYITSVTGYTAAVTSTASATTGDVRGTYALQSASNGSNRLNVFQSPLVYNMAPTNGTGLFGVTQA